MALIMAFRPWQCSALISYLRLDIENSLFSSVIRISMGMDEDSEDCFGG
jgi:hypothetical protein